MTVEDGARSGGIEGAPDPPGRVDRISQREKPFILGRCLARGLHLIDAFIHDFSTETDSFSPDGVFQRVSLSSFEWMDEQRGARTACAASCVGSDLGLDSGDFLDAFLEKSFDALMQGVRA